MSKIKYIHCLGTSHTEGGGFEFDSNNQIKQNLKTIYKPTGEKLTRSNFSYPGQLKNILKKNKHKISIINHGKSGFGNQKMYRDTFDIVYDDSFDLSEHLFIYEFSWIGRSEYYLNTINDYVTFNYFFEDGKLINKGDVANNYYYDSNDTLDKTKKFKDTLIPFFKLSANEDEIIKRLERNTSFFYSFLKSINLNFLLLNPPPSAVYLDSKKSNLLYSGYETYNIKIWDGEYLYDGIDDILNSKKYSIKTETQNRVNDLHNGLVANNLIAQNLYNRLIDDEYISGDKMTISKLDIQLNLNSNNYDKKLF